MIAGRPLVRVLVALGLFLSGCAVHSPFDRDKVSRGVEARVESFFEDRGHSWQVQQ